MNGLINRLPYEMHYLGQIFHGPGTELNKWLKADLTPKDCSQTIDRDDDVAYRHDVFYLSAVDLLRHLNKIENPTASEKWHIRLAKAVIRAKKVLKRVLKRVLWTDALAEEVHKPVRHHLPNGRFWMMIWHIGRYVPCCGRQQLESSSCSLRSMCFPSMEGFVLVMCPSRVSPSQAESIINEPVHKSNIEPTVARSQAMHNTEQNEIYIYTNYS